MSEKPYYHDENPSFQIAIWVFRQMLRGAGWSALVFFGIIAFYYVLRLIAGFLPVDPNAALDAADMLTRLV
jgi:Intrinsic membrane protein PufX